MVQWTTFAGITGVVLVLLLVLSHLTQSAFDDGDLERESGDDVVATAGERAIDPDSSRSNATVDSEGVSDAATTPTSTGASVDRESGDAADYSAQGRSSRESDEPVGFDEFGDVGEFDTDRDREELSEQPPEREYDRGRSVDPESLSTGALLANVAFSQGLFALVLLGAVLYTGIPADALGIEFSVAYLEQGLLLGAAAGIVLYVANEIGAATATRLGFDHDEELRGLLAPDSIQGWLALLLVVLPIIAVFEELLFRAALIGVISAGFGVSPWLLAVVSSVAFAVGHGVQGSVGVVVTGLLGFVLAAIFIVTGSFLVVVVAHYLINAFEFIVHEGVGLEWSRTLES
ncbi:CPBP family intramembrane metalloprotease [Natronorubrum sp. JWXQ-INN-674]|uniref:CPBP family intramembrane metalloprotease n=1 Tax=Natronorubrum halalkaliphilum TaxID=2691917 RepID=A0A6B0VID2_9EURY|nr:CPBP family intramembrane glutamic endopeptidase [Natronorubrum halalkaliphilum]MXV60815.1 CPBP family intramembrane metalloprotease [Natronorubrum halalkaliphilum]